MTIKRFRPSQALVDFGDLAQSAEFKEFFEIARELTGMMVTLADPTLTREHRLYPLPAVAPFCHLVQSCPRGLAGCIRTDRIHRETAIRRRHAIAYHCHAGLVDMMIPVFVGDYHVATITCGRVVDAPHSVKEFRRLQRKLAPLKLNPTRLRAAYDRIPYCPPERIRKVMRFFSFFAEYFGEIGWRLKKTEIPDAGSIQKAKQFIHDHFRESLGLKVIARQAGVSAAYFSAEFHRKTGGTVMAYVRQMRLNAVMKLLATTQRPVTELAFESGFNNLSHFNRVFRNALHCAPREYRRTHQVSAG